MTVTVRTAVPGDSATIVALVNLAYRVEDFFINGNRTHEGEVAELLAADTFLVAEDESGAAVGCVHIQLNAERGYFGMLSVAPSAQGTGLGRRLVAEAERFAAEAGCTAMDLTYVDLREELPAFYAKLGYQPTGERPFTDTKKLKMPAKFITMSKPLAPAQRRPA